MDTSLLAIYAHAQAIPGHAQGTRVYIGRSGLEFAVLV